MFCWTVHLTGGPKKGSRHAVAIGDKVYTFGEFYDEDTAQIEVHVFNTVSLRWNKLSPVTSGRGERHHEVLSSLYGLTAVLIEDTVYLWGGCSGRRIENCNLLYGFEVDTHRWFKPRVSGTVPEGRWNHSACVLGKLMFIHGGKTLLTDDYTNDTYKLDPAAMVWTLINTRDTPPPASEGHTVTTIGTKMFVFGGRGSFGQYNNTIRVFDTENNLWLNTPSAELLPEGDWFHSAFAYNGELYRIHSLIDLQPSTDLWKFNPETFAWRKIQLKREGSCPMGTMCCCMVGDRIIFSGKYRDDQLYVLDLSPSLKTLCKLAVIQYGLDQSELPHNIRWELAAMTTNSNGQRTKE